MNLTTTTPPKISDEIVAFCRSIDPTTSPEFVEVIPSASGVAKECFETTNAHTAMHGGTVQYGWTIWETPDVLLDAEFHAVWRDAKGTLIDVTPKDDGETRILFLPDSKRVWEKDLIPNIRKILRDSPQLQYHLQMADLVYSIKRKHFKNGSVDAEAASRELTTALSASQLQPIRRTARVGRNAPCPCGSGNKFKKCCGAS